MGSTKTRNGTERNGTNGTNGMNNKIKILVVRMRSLHVHHSLKALEQTEGMADVIVIESDSDSCSERPSTPRVSEVIRQNVGHYSYPLID